MKRTPDATERTAKSGAKGLATTARAEAKRRAAVGEARRMRTRTALLQAAMSVLGHEAGRFATVDELIAQAGVSRGTFYNHFAGREQLLEAVSFQLSHDFNEALDASLGPNTDAAERAAAWIRHYLHRVRVEPQWGWSLVNVSLSGPRLMGEESYNAARANLEAGCAQGVFKVDNIDAALDLSLGGVLACAISILRGSLPSDYPEAAAQAALRAFGISEARARKIVAAPLSKVSLRASID